MATFRLSPFFVRASCGICVLLIWGVLSTGLTSGFSMVAQAFKKKKRGIQRIKKNSRFTFISSRSEIYIILLDAGSALSFASMGSTPPSCDV
jgi:hypothetical protein